MLTPIWTSVAYQSVSIGVLVVNWLTGGFGKITHRTLRAISQLETLTGYGR
jgi:hypothetical protein